eukprot:UN23411
MVSGLILFVICQLILALNHCLVLGCPGCCYRGILGNRFPECCFKVCLPRTVGTLPGKLARYEYLNQAQYSGLCVCLSRLSQEFDIFGVAENPFKRFGADKTDRISFMRAAVVVEKKDTSLKQDTK